MKRWLCQRKPAEIRLIGVHKRWELCYNTVLEFSPHKEGGKPVKLRKLCVLAALTALLACLSGCLFQSVDELYSLPRLPEDYYDLQACLDEVLSGDAEYAAPVSGSQQQAVQLVDLDGDGEKEALAFVKTTGDKPLKVYIFCKVDGTYQNAAVIEGDGSAFQSVAYAQVDDDEALELIICRQVSDQVPQAISVYDLSAQFSATELMSATCSDYRVVDLNSDSVFELFLLCSSGDSGGTVEWYSWSQGIMEKNGEARLSAPADAARRVLTGSLEDGASAVFVASTYDENSLVTDVFALRDGQLVNIAADSQADGVTQTVRNYYVYATDVDNDGVLELPMPIPLPSADSENTESYWIIQWYSLSLDGSTTDKSLTYHNYSAGWFLELPSEWRDQITVYRSDNAYVFAAWRGADETPQPLFSIGAATEGESLPENSTVLTEQNGTTYYLTITQGAENWSSEITAEALSQRFHMIQTNWYNGEM